MQCRTYIRSVSCPWLDNQTIKPLYQVSVCSVTVMNSLAIQTVLDISISGVCLSHIVAMISILCMLWIYISSTYTSSMSANYGLLAKTQLSPGWGRGRSDCSPSMRFFSASLLKMTSPTEFEYQGELQTSK